MGSNQGAAVFTVNSTPSASGTLAVLNREGRPVFDVEALTEGGRVRQLDHRGRPMIISGVDPDAGAGRITILNGLGNEIVRAAAGKGDSGRVTVFDADGKESKSLDG